jgi:hypothetical protein
MTDHAFYAAQSGITDPGRFTDRVAEVASDLTAMRTAARELVFHYRADGDFAANGIEASRIAEVDTRYAEDMLARLFQLADLPLGHPRTPAQRLGGCCRDFARRARRAGGGHLLRRRAAGAGPVVRTA